MKRSILAAILGVAAATSVFGQGHVLFSNYLTAPYNQVFWNPALNQAPPGRGNTAVTAGDNVQFQMWYGEGVIADDTLLLPGALFQIAASGGGPTYNPGAGHGAGGYYLSVDQALPTWQPGDTFTFELRVIGGPPGVTGKSVLWQQGGTTLQDVGSPANQMTIVPGLMVSVPEPTTFALAGLGAAAMLIFRRRNS